MRSLSVLSICLCFHIACTNEPDSDLIIWQNNWNKWQSMDMTKYSFGFRASCNCIDEWVREVNVSVSNDTITSVFFIDDSLPPIKLQFDQWHTINALFDFSKSFIEQAYQYDIQYDNTYGNPTLMLVDWDSDIADDEVTFFVNNVIKY